MFQTCKNELAQSRDGAISTALHSVFTLLEMYVDDTPIYIPSSAFSVARLHCG